MAILHAALPQLSLESESAERIFAKGKREDDVSDYFMIRYLLKSLFFAGR